MNTVDLTVVVPFRNRDVNRVRMTVKSLLRASPRHRIEIIVSDFGTERPEELAALCAELGIGYVRQEATYWNKPMCLNAAVRVAQSELILCGDVDMYWGEGTLSHVLERVVSDDVLIAFQTRDLEALMTDPIIAGVEPTLQELRDASRIHSRWGNGVLLFRRSDWQLVNGYDERISVYGAEDLDFCTRIQRLGRRFQWSDFRTEPVFHVWHPRFNDTKKPWVNRVIARNRTLFRERPSWFRNPGSLSSSDEPLVSVAIATIGRPGMLEEAIASVLCQTMQSFEIIVVEDGEEGLARDIVDSFGDERIRYFDQPHRGIAAARNVALDHARGMFTAVLDDDDLMPPWRLEESLTRMSGGSAGVVGYFVNFSDLTGELTSWGDNEPNTEAALRTAGFAGHSTWLMRTDAMRAIRYDESYSSAVDNNLAMRLLASGLTLEHSLQVLNIRRLHEGQVSNRDAKEQGHGAHLTRHWVQAPLTSSQIQEATKDVASKRQSVPPSTEMRDSVRPFLPDHLVDRRILVAIPDVAVATRMLEQGLLHTWCSAKLVLDDTVVASVVRGAQDGATWRSMARCAQLGAVLLETTTLDDAAALDSIDMIVAGAAYAKAVDELAALTELRGSVVGEWRLEPSQTVAGAWVRRAIALDRDREQLASASIQVASSSSIPLVFESARWRISEDE